MHALSTRIRRLHTSRSRVNVRCRRERVSERYRPQGEGIRSSWTVSTAAAAQRGTREHHRHCHDLCRWHEPSGCGDLQGVGISGEMVAEQPAVCDRLGYSKKGYTKKKRPLADDGSFWSTGTTPITPWASSFMRGSSASQSSATLPTLRTSIKALML